MSQEELSPARFGDAFKAFLEAVSQASPAPEGALGGRIRDHLGVDPANLPVIAEEFDPFEHPHVQVALDAYLSAPDRDAELVGVAAQQRHYARLGLATITGQAKIPGVPLVIEGSVDYVNFHLDAGRVMPCVQLGPYLIRDGGASFSASVIGPSEYQGPRPRIRVEVMAAEPELASAFLMELREEMSRLNVYRGHVISLSPEALGMGPQTLVAFHTIPEVARGDVILPEALLVRIERQTLAFAEHAEQLLTSGRSLKRGVLLYGPPGTGKTLTLMYLIGRMPGRTVLLTTGLGMGLFQTVAQMARTLAPAIVVLEDVDLIAEEQGRPFGGAPLLFELLNEMDGFADDADVTFALPTNRPEVLEPALAARP